MELKVAFAALSFSIPQISLSAGLVGVSANAPVTRSVWQDLFCRRDLPCNTYACNAGKLMGKFVIYCELDGH